MKLGIIGKPQSGKTTVFNAAAGRQETVGDFSQAVHRAVIKVPDRRLDQLAEIVKPPKVTCVEIEFLDAPGLPSKGTHTSSFEISPELRQTEALVIVVAAFASDANPRRDLLELRDEMILADQLLIESSIERKTRKMKLTGDKSEIRELDLLKLALDVLEQNTPLIDLPLSEDDARLLRGYMLLSQKPVLALVNIAEEDLPRADAHLTDLADLHAPGKCDLAVLCGQIEMELAALPAEEQQEFLKELGISTPAVDRVIQKSYDLLGLISFFTVEGPELRAWPIRSGTMALKAAGAVHSDIERGFIRAEVTAYDDFVAYKTPAALKAAGKTRLEGKEYVVQDGDVIRFRFNV